MGKSLEAFMALSFLSMVLMFQNCGEFQIPRDVKSKTASSTVDRDPANTIPDPATDSKDDMNPNEPGQPSEPAPASPVGMVCAVANGSGVYVSDSMGAVTCQASSCNSGYLLGNGACTLVMEIPVPNPNPTSKLNIADILNGMRIELTCKGTPSQTTETCGWDTAKYTQHGKVKRKIGGDPAKIYDVDVRVRGVFEGRVYNDKNGIRFVPQKMPAVLEGGAPASGGDYNPYYLTVAEPKVTYHLNAVTKTGHQVYKLDTVIKMKMKGGTEVALNYDDSNFEMIANTNATARIDNPDTKTGNAWVIPDVAPYPNAFNGHFVQIDILDTQLAP